MAYALAFMNRLSGVGTVATNGIAVRTSATAFRATCHPALNDRNVLSMFHSKCDKHRDPRTTPIFLKDGGRRVLRRPHREISVEAVRGSNGRWRPLPNQSAQLRIGQAVHASRSCVFQQGVSNICQMTASFSLKASLCEPLIWNQNARAKGQFSESRVADGDADEFKDVRFATSSGRTTYSWKVSRSRSSEASSFFARAFMRPSS